jgi:hypothetical protein
VAKSECDLVRRERPQGRVPLSEAARQSSLRLRHFGAPDAYDVLRQAFDSLSEDDRIEAHGEARLIAIASSHGVASTVRS